MKFTKIHKHKKLLFGLSIIGIICVSTSVIAFSMYLFKNYRISIGKTTSSVTADTTTSTSTGVVGISRGDISNISEITVDGLLQDTNKNRLGNSATAVALNNTLNISAKAKCDDMVAKNYWSHDTPSGQKPWVFIEGAGYKYSKSGENLAYGFRNSVDVVTGWMNSPTHKANLLDSKFKDVGFGICNSKDYVSRGYQIIVVQHFGTPEVKTTLPKPVQKQPPSKPYVAPVCTKIPIPYKTIYKDASYLDVGQMTEYGGTDGYINRCTSDSMGYTPADYTIQPYDKTIYVGTHIP